MQFDFIGDIHGHADQLETLLKKIDYAKVNGTYKHPERKAFFIGDYIDRGPKIKETLKIVREMTEAGNAVALMGNHEYNALCFHHEHKEGGHLRPHNLQNIMQHYETLASFKHQQKEYESYLEWFMTLPMFYESETFNAVHACWDNQSISLLKEITSDAKLNPEILYNSAIENSQLYIAVEVVLKGLELTLPSGRYFHDKDGIERNNIRIKWWEDLENKTYKDIAVKKDVELPDETIDTAVIKTEHYQQQKPVFFGHYWMEGQPELFKDNVCCLDYSVAKKGILAAYRFDNEKTLSNSKFITV